MLRHSASVELHDQTPRERFNLNFASIFLQDRSIKVIDWSN